MLSESVLVCEKKVVLNFFLSFLFQFQRIWKIHEFNKSNIIQESFEKNVYLWTRSLIHNFVIVPLYECVIVELTIAN